MLVVSPLSRVGDGGSSGNLVLPVEIDKIPPYPAKSSGGFRISIRYNAAPLTSFWFPAAKQPGPSSVESTWEVESEIYGVVFGLHGTIHRIHNILSIYFGDIGQILDIFSTKAMGHTTSAPRGSIQLLSDHCI
jgi:hypothetical protein